MRKILKMEYGELNIPNSNKFNSLSDVGLRYNKKRNFLFLSKVLGKYLDTKPSKMTETFKELASKIQKENYKGKTLVIGFAETATALGEGVFDMLQLKDSYYISTTRTMIKDENVWLEFSEEHSHATAHLIYEPKFNTNDFKNVILIDDEFTTGNTLKNIIASLKIQLPTVENFMALSILDWSKDMGFDKRSIYRADFTFDAYPDVEINNNPYKSTSNKKIVLNNSTSRFGRKLEYIPEFRDKFINNVISIAYKIPISENILIVGSGEFMYEAYLIGRQIEAFGYDIKMKSTGRSPIQMYGAINNIDIFKDHLGEDLDFFLYNMKQYDNIIYLPETLNDYSSVEILKKYTKNLILLKYD